MNNIYSTREELDRISQSLAIYLKLPFVADSVPGAYMEAIIANVKRAEVLKTYDFVDVVNHQQNIGWQVKSTKSNTPVTWKRVKLPNSVQLIEKSKENKRDCQHLGNLIIQHCNNHAKESLEKYGLKSIGFARLIVFPKERVIKYYERELCTFRNPNIFDANEFEWVWSKPKKSEKKEQLPALQGINRTTNTKWFAWHGSSENQLHFEGEKYWWPPITNSPYSIEMDFPSEKLTQQQLIDLIEATDN